MYELVRPFNILLQEWAGFLSKFAGLYKYREMKGFQKWGVAGLMLVCLVGLSGWGFLVHRTIHQLAIYQLPVEMSGFFHSNMSKLVYDAPRADIRRNTDSSEAPKHFMDLEPYKVKTALQLPSGFDKAIQRYSWDTLKKYGYVPYQIMVMKDKLTEAFKNQNKDSILFYAADLGHYIGDANVPLHTTLNYDGQLTNQAGMHGLWESMIPELEMETYRLFNGHKAQYLRNPMREVQKAMQRAHKLLPDILEMEKKVSLSFTDSTKYRYQMRNGKQSRSYTSGFAKAYAEQLKPTINQQLLHSATMIADFWYTAWVDAGKPDLSNLFQASTEKQTKYAVEVEAYKNNRLITDNLLEAKKKQ